MQGKFITFEGPEGSGKSTQIKLLAEKLEAQGIEFICSREPGGTVTGEVIRNMLQHDSVNEKLADRTELLLFAASRAQLMNQVILPSLALGSWVLCDRFIDSTMAYQGYARGMELETLAVINAFAIQDKKPDMTILLDLDVERGFERLAARYTDTQETHDRFEREARDFHQRVRDGYHQLAVDNPGRFRTINADREIHEIAHDVWKVVKQGLL